MKRLYSVKSNCSYPAGPIPALFLACNPIALVVILCVLLFTPSLFAQSFTPFNPAKFGVDGDAMAETRLQGTFPVAGSHDWFQQNDQSGYSVFDTTGTKEMNNRISAGQNYAFSKRMAYNQYAVLDGLLMLDGLYARDYFGTSSLGSNSDKTVFLNPSNNNKSFTNPSVWTTVPLGASVPAKSDLIDTYIHMRRNGTSISETNPSNLFVYFAATTLSTNGDHYLDFELFKSDITYNAVTGLFSNSGPATTGGRSSWEFNQDGSIKTFGDMSLSFSFDNAAISEIAIYIWVPYSVYATTNPTGFDFYHTNGGWAGSSQNSGYGYARIVPNPGQELQAWGAINQVATPAPLWGTNAANLGSLSNNYYSSQYSTGQLAEAAIDLTSIGIDPVLSSDYDRCAPPYVKVLVKSRSSSSFSSALQDFVTPFAFLNHTEVISPVAVSNQLSCTTPSATLTATNSVQSAFYSWSTTNGHIVTGQNNTQATIDQPGEYTLSSAIYDGCPVSTTTISVVKDGYQPVASAGQTGVLTNDPSSYITLRGGDENESNYATPFGSSQGLQWSWTGPEGFVSNAQNSKATKEGSYQLIVTEKRNGCKDTALIQISKAIPLALNLQQFSGSRINNQIKLHWLVGENESGAAFEIQRSIGGSNFITEALLFPTEETGTAAYSYNIAEADKKIIYYRLKLTDKKNKISYSKTLRLEETQQNIGQAYIYQPSGISQSILYYESNNEDLLVINLYDASGSRLASLKKSAHSGANRILLPVEKNKSFFLAEVLTESQRMIIKAVN